MAVTNYKVKVTVPGDPETEAEVVVNGTNLALTVDALGILKITDGSVTKGYFRNWNRITDS